MKNTLYIREIFESVLNWECLSDYFIFWTFLSRMKNGYVVKLFICWSWVKFVMFQSLGFFTTGKKGRWRSVSFVCLDMLLTRISISLFVLYVRDKSCNEHLSHFYWSDWFTTWYKFLNEYVLNKSRFFLLRLMVIKTSDFNTKDTNNFDRMSI